MKFYKLTVRCPSEASDIVSYVLHESGSMGEVFDDYRNIEQVLREKRWDYADASLFEKFDGCCVSGFFTLETDIESVRGKINDLRNCDYADFSSIESDVSTIDSVEWEDEWKKYYKPFGIGDITIIPEWITYKPEANEIPVYLNPGPAFGTGTHETTSMCIELMQRVPIKGARVLDFGCGSGILGICASKLGASSVLFADTDDQAVKATEYNCKINGMENPEVLLCDVRNIDKPADIVVANITADVLTEVEPIIRSALKKGGYVIISGIISDKADAIKKHYAENFEYVYGENKNEWSAFIFKL